MEVRKELEYLGGVEVREIHRCAEGKERRGTQNNSRSASVLRRKSFRVGNMLDRLLREEIWES